MGQQLIYNRKKDYYSISNKFTLVGFQTQFLDIQNEDLEKAYGILRNIQELKVFYLAEDFEKFSRLIDKIIDLLEDYYILQPRLETEFYN